MGGASRGGIGEDTTNSDTNSMNTLYISARYSMKPGMKSSIWLIGGMVLVVRQYT